MSSAGFRSSLCRFKAQLLIRFALLRHLSSHHHGQETAKGHASRSRPCVDSASEASMTSNYRPLRKLPDPSRNGWLTYRQIASGTLPLLPSPQVSAHHPSNLHSRPTAPRLRRPSPNHHPRHHYLSLNPSILHPETFTSSSPCLCTIAIEAAAGSIFLPHHRPTPPISRSKGAQVVVPALHPPML